mmetsp:Transcript_11307/g.35964  ORF Transcript_11307/g.35964 Transcript_11307/m.35964 type:complete len:293 (-) Transcript_11307:297-1175(-)
MPKATCRVLRAACPAHRPTPPCHAMGCSALLHLHQRLLILWLQLRCDVLDDVRVHVVLSGLVPEICDGLRIVIVVERGDEKDRQTILDEIQGILNAKHDGGGAQENASEDGIHQPIHAAADFPLGQVRDGNARKNIVTFLLLFIRPELFINNLLPEVRLESGARLVLAHDGSYDDCKHPLHQGDFVHIVRGRIGVQVEDIVRHETALRNEEEHRPPERPRDEHVDVLERAFRICLQVGWRVLTLHQPGQILCNELRRRLGPFTRGSDLPQHHSVEEDEHATEDERFAFAARA